MKTSSPAILTPTLSLLLIACWGEEPTTVTLTYPDDRASADPIDAAWRLVGELEGSWKNQLDGGDTLSYEHWTRHDSLLWTGLGCVLIGGDTTFIEDLQIERNGKAITYAARISTQNKGEWVVFDLKPSGADTLLFVNPEHDFPKELRYVRAADGSWHVTVGNADRSFALHFARSTR